MTKIKILISLIPILLMPAISNADIDANKGFPAKDFKDFDVLSMLAACCENNATCCIDFSDSTSVNDFRNKVKTLNLYRDSEITSRMTTIQIKQRLNNTERTYENRFNNMGNPNYRPDYRRFPNR
jgi:hypothetical protein